MTALDRLGEPGGVVTGAPCAAISEQRMPATIGITMFLSRLLGSRPVVCLLLAPFGEHRRPNDALRGQLCDLGAGEPEKTR